MKSGGDNEVLVSLVNRKFLSWIVILVISLLKGLIFGVKFNLLNLV